MTVTVAVTVGAFVIKILIWSQDLLGDETRGSGESVPAAGTSSNSLTPDIRSPASLSAVSRSYQLEEEVGEQLSQILITSRSLHNELID